jgi:hypothetical protein
MTTRITTHLKITITITITTTSNKIGSSKNNFIRVFIIVKI